MNRPRAVALVSGILILLAPAVVYANGRRPPEPSNTSPVKATCLDRAGGSEIVLFRVRLTSGAGTGEMLRVLVGSADETLGLQDVERLILPGASINNDGFTKAEVVRIGEDEATPAMVQVQSASAKVRLTGFSASGGALQVDLSKCKEVTFASAATEGEVPKRKVKKK